MRETERPTCAGIANPAIHAESFRQGSAAMMGFQRSGESAVLTTFASYQINARDIDAAIDRVKSQPQVERESAYYLENIENVDTIEEFVSDYRLFSYAMKAHGLEDMTYARAFMTKLLEGGRDDNDAMANTLTDPRYLEFATTYDFDRYGDIATTFTKARQGTVDKFLRQTLEESEGAKNEGVRLALYFERKAPDVETITDILANPAMSQVVRTTLGLPAATATMDIDRQIALIADRLDVEDFQDSDKLMEFIDRFTNLWDVNNSAQNATSDLAVIFSQPLAFGISTDVMTAMQGLKR